ncbi:hypothetical protein L798_12240 [Zootermopsis nevadensis]|uniref:Endonuclease-reverse transcriptase n=1 Tax=Zootermopsis nevadensis TaxID=136037 RepID=A0A067R2R1_ZOONE|nr:hypothetical protein L798_12240 [Zootermopsis nevadensis]
MIHEKIKSRLNSGNAYYHSVQNLPSFHLLFKNIKIKIYKIIILPWSLTLRDEYTMRVLQVFENRVLRRIFGPRREDDGVWRKLHNDKLKNLNSSPNIVRVIKSRRMRWVGHIVCMDGTRGVHWVLVGKPEGKRPLGRPRHRWEDNLRRDPWEIGVEGDWILLAQVEGFG